MSLRALMVQFESKARLLKVIAHPTRLRLLNALCGGEECVCHLTALLNQRQAYISQQLMFLRQAGLLTDRKEGSRVYYRIKEKSLFQILRAMNVTRTRAKSLARQSIATCPCPQCARQHKKVARKMRLRNRVK